MTPHFDHQQLRAAERELRAVERERSLADARAALRAEREQVVADRAEVDRLLAEARDIHRDAERERHRARRLAPRFVRWVKKRHSHRRNSIGQQEARLAAERDKIAAEFKRLAHIRSEFHAAAVSMRDRLRDAWNAVEAQQQRAAADWGQAERFFTEQSAELESRNADLVRREKALGDLRARFEAEAVGLREETAAMETRVESARSALSELETHREQMRAELLAAEPPAELTLYTGDDSGDSADRAAELAREQTAVAALKESLERESAELNDRKRVLAEQLALLADARNQWQNAERQTVIEMEEMARDLHEREADLDAREHRLIRADVRRREDGYELWQLRLRLESWQTRLTAFEVRWHTEREHMEADLERRMAIVGSRETELERTFAHWEQARADERQRLRAELDHWVADRDKLARAVAGIDVQQQLHDAELSTCAARALAAEELAASATPEDGAERAKRRLAVLRKRWEKVFDHKVKEIDTRRAEMTAELNGITERYKRLHSLLAGVVEREAAANNAAAKADLERTVVIGPVSVKPVVVGSVSVSPPAMDMDRLSRPSVIPELAALREEIERVAVIMLDMDIPEAPENELPWGSEEIAESPASVFQFDKKAKAA
jgi:chromosome segregation ATPase